MMQISLGFPHLNLNDRLREYRPQDSAEDATADEDEGVRQKRSHVA